MRNLSPILFSILFLLNTSLSFSNNYIVTNTNDNGIGSLREAINLSNMNPGGDTITFQIPVSDPNYNASTGIWTIAPDSTLPYLWEGNTIVDGNSQTINEGNTNPFGPEIMIDGRNMLDYGLALVSIGNKVLNLVIGNCNNGIEIAGANSGYNVVQNCFIGVNYNGSQAFPNTNGILMANETTDNVITNNLISGNTSEGIMIYQAFNNTVTANKIGTDASGTLALPNSDGVLLNETVNNNIGGYSSQRNIISGNTNAGIIMYGNGTRQNKIAGNYIGADISGMQFLSNYTGVILKSQASNNIIGDNSPSYRNLISGNTEIGVYIESSDSNQVIGNYIGPDTTGNTAFKIGDSLYQSNGIEINTTSKHNVIGGYTTAERNVISGNRVYGFVYYGNVSYNPLIGNYIGTNATGTAKLPNATGICVDGGSNHNLISNNLLSGNMNYGIFIVTTGTYHNELKGNLIGTNAAGTDTIPNEIGLIMAGGARYNIIGGSDATDRNIISGNRYDGIEIADQFTDSNSVTGNYIGTDITGTLRLGNSIGIGIATNPRHNTMDGNLISGNKRMGIVLYENADSNRVINNKIGTNASGNSNLGNGSAGIVIDNGASGNLIGMPGSGNTIAFNDSSGVVIADNNTKHDRISANSMWSNFGLGIDIFPPMVNPNDPGDYDTGPNDLMNFPVITSAEYHNNGNYTVVKGTLDTQQPQLCMVELFLAAPNFFNHGDGKTYLGSTMPDTAGNWCDTITGVVNGNPITTTATDALMNTSEFSANYITTLFSGLDKTNDNGFSLLVYPNPVSGDFITMEFQSDKEESVNIELYNTQGALLLNTEKLNFTKDKQQVRLNVGNLAAGIYYFTALTNNTKITKMIVKIAQ